MIDFLDKICKGQQNLWDKLKKTSQEPSLNIVCQLPLLLQGANPSVQEHNEKVQKNASNIDSNLYSLNDSQQSFEHILDNIVLSRRMQNKDLVS